MQTVGTNTTSWTPSTFDLTPYVARRPYRISVDVKGRYALRDADGYFTVPEAASWSTNIAQGIFQSARLEVFPALYISDAVVRTSVQNRSLQYDVRVTNSTDRPQTAQLDAGSAPGTGPVALPEARRRVGDRPRARDAHVHVRCRSLEPRPGSPTGGRTSPTGPATARSCTSSTR